MYLKRYQQCTTAEEVSAAQDVLLAELEESWKESHKETGALIFYTYIIISLYKDSQDLLVANPNHAILTDSDEE